MGVVLTLRLQSVQRKQMVQRYPKAIRHLRQILPRIVSTYIFRARRYLAAYLKIWFILPIPNH